MSIEIENLEFFYKTENLEVQALKNISLTIKEGEFLGIAGQTGSGKSTFVQHLNGLLQPAKGRVLVDGWDMADKRQRGQGRAKVGLVFQYPEYQLFEKTVEKDIAFGPKNLQLGEEESKRRVEEAMIFLGLDPFVYAKRSPFELSGGEKRRVAIAGVVAMGPKYLVLDEPLAGLDPGGRKQLFQTLEALREKDGCTVIMVSHSMDIMAQWADRIAVFSQGSLICCGPPGEVFANLERMPEMNLEQPQTVQLARALRERGMPVPEGICRMEDMLCFLEGRLKADE